MVIAASTYPEMRPILARMTWPPPSPQPPLGPTDAEREPVVVALKEHYAAGRLSLEDFESRVEAIYQARSVPELHHLAADLGSPPALPGGHRRRNLRIMLAACLGAVLLSTTVYLGFRVPPAAGPDGGGQPSPLNAAPLDTSSTQTGTPAQAAGEAYLRAIEHEQWDRAQAQMCLAMRKRYPTGAAIAKAVYADNGQRPANHQILSAGPVDDEYRLRYALYWPSAAGGPYEMRLVRQDGGWRMCGAGRDRGRLTGVLLP